MNRIYSVFLWWRQFNYREKSKEDPPRLKVSLNLFTFFGYFCLIFRLFICIPLLLGIILKSYIYPVLRMKEVPLKEWILVSNHGGNRLLGGRSNF